MRYGIASRTCAAPTRSASADDLEVPNHGIDGLLVGEECFAVEPSRIAFDLADGRDDVLEKEGDVPLRHRSARVDERPERRLDGAAGHEIDASAHRVFEVSAEIDEPKPDGGVHVDEHVDVTVHACFAAGP
jgi:hypothetical protein